MKTFMLLLAFVVIDPDGVKMDEEVHVLSRHFDAEDDCRDFVRSWGDVIRTRGPEKVQEMVDDRYKISLKYVGCVNTPDQSKLEIKPLEEAEPSDE